MENLMWLISSGAAGIGGLTLLWFLASIGVFSQLVMEKIYLGPMLILYENKVGPYDKAFSPKAHWVAVGRKYGLCDKYPKTVGLFFDDPKRVTSSQCRSSVGYIVMENEPTSMLESGRQDLLNSPLVTKEGLKVGIFNTSECLRVKVPLSKILPWVSIILAVVRVYGSKDLAKRIEGENKACEGRSDGDACYGTIEVYDFEKGVHSFHFPLEARKELLAYNRETGQPEKDMAGVTQVIESIRASDVSAGKGKGAGM